MTFKLLPLWIFYHKNPFRYSIYILCCSHLLLLIGSYVFWTRACISFHKLESSQSYHAQVEYGSELVEADHSKIYKIDMIKQFQGPAHTIVLSKQYHHNIALCHLTWYVYQLLIIFFSESHHLTYLEKCVLFIGERETQEFMLQS